MFEPFRFTTDFFDGLVEKVAVVTALQLRDQLVLFSPWLCFNDNFESSPAHLPELSTIVPDRVDLSDVSYLADEHQLDET